MVVREHRRDLHRRADHVEARAVDVDLAEEHAERAVTIRLLSGENVPSSGKVPPLPCPGKRVSGLYPAAARPASTCARMSARRAPVFASKICICPGTRMREESRLTSAWKRAPADGIGTKQPLGPSLLIVSTV